MDKEVSSLKHLFVTVFLSNFAIMVVNPAIIDITMDAICPSQDKCSLAIYLSGFQQAVSTPILLSIFLLINWSIGDEEQYVELLYKEEEL